GETKTAAADRPADGAQQRDAESTGQSAEGLQPFFAGATIMSATTPDDMPDVPFVPNANPYGPSDSSDTASERPSGDVESDAAGTGERASADPPYVDDVADDAPDIRPDKAVDADDAGVSWT